MFDLVAGHDAPAAPICNGFTTRLDPTFSDAIQPEWPPRRRNPQAVASWSASADAALVLQLPFDRPDLVPLELSDQVLWRTVYG
jgi:hypothetical protein